MREGNRFKRGYTLVELLVVVAIMAVIVGISVSGLILQQKKARDSRRKADLETIRAAFEEHRRKYNYYQGHGGNTWDWVDDTTFPMFSSALPKDPLASQGYRYKVFWDTPCTVSGGINQCKTYLLKAYLETGTQVGCGAPQRCNSSLVKCCNYSVTQP